MIKRISGDLGIIAFGIFLLYMPFLIAASIAYNPYNDYQLIRYGKNTTGVVVDSYQEVVEENDGRSVHVEERCTYRFSAPDGQTISKTCSVSKELSGAIDIEYLPANPHISRIKGEGVTTLKGLFWRSLLGVLLFAFHFVIAGSVIKFGVNSLRVNIKAT